MLFQLRSGLKMSNYKNRSLERVKAEILGVNSYSVPNIECSIRLDGNESPFETGPELSKIISDSLASIELNRYPDPDSTVLKQVVSEKYDFPADGLLLGNGSDELIQMLIETVTGKSGVVLVPSPTFSMYRLTSLILDNKVVESDLDENFDLDTEDILKKIDESDPDLLFFASPNNPTGNAFSTDKIIEIVEATTGVVVVDEAYYDYYGDTVIPLIQKYDNLVVLRTLSKIGFAAIRLGILFAGSEIADQVNKTRLPYNINTVSQKIAEIVFSNDHILMENHKKIVSEKERLFNELNKIENIKVYPSDANFFLIKVPDADYCFKTMAEKDILIRNLGRPGRLSGCIRVTIGTSEENNAFLEALSAISFS